MVTFPEVLIDIHALNSTSVGSAPIFWIIPAAPLLPGSNMPRKSPEPVIPVVFRKFLLETPLDSDDCIMLLFFQLMIDLSRCISTCFYPCVPCFHKFIIGEWRWFASFSHIPSCFYKSVFGMIQ